MDSNPIDITLLCNQIETRLNHRPGHLIIKLITTKSYLTYLLILPGLLAMLTSDSCIQTYLSPPPCCCMPTCCLIPAITSQAFILNIPTFGTSSSSSTYSWRSPWLLHIEKKASMVSNPGVALWLYIKEAISDLGRVSSGTITLLPQRVVIDQQSNIDSSTITERTWRRNNAGVDLAKKMGGGLLV